MKPVQVLFDEPLLTRLDADEEVRRDGRGDGLGEEFAGWESEGSWPER